MKMRVWYEYFETEEAVAPDTVNLLKKYDVSVGLAFPHGSMNEDYARILSTYHDQGIATALWVLLPDEQGYWPNERNVVEFSDYVRRVFDWAEENKFALPEIAVDLEPPIYQMEALKKAANPRERINVLRKCFGENRDHGRFYDASHRFEELNEFIHARGSRTLCPVPSHIVLDVATGGIGVQDLLETPITTVNWDMLSAMIYTSMLVGYSKGTISQKDARWYLYSVMREFKEKYWERAGVSIGVTYTGKLGDEPYYDKPEDLLPDMKAAKAALIDDITIYNLEGILRSPRPGAWFDMLLEAEPEAPERSLRVDMVRSAAKAAVRLL